MKFSKGINDINQIYVEYLLVDERPPTLLQIYTDQGMMKRQDFRPGTNINWHI